MEANEKKMFLGKPIKLVAALILLILLFILFLWLCKSHNEGKLVITKPVKAPVAISFRDANRLLEVQIPTVKVTLIDDEGQVVTPNNLLFSSLEIKGGVMVLALKDSAVFNRERPYRFTIKTEAQGYSTNYRSIVISEDKEQYIVVFMAKIDDPPAGMAGFTGAIPVSKSTSQSGITLLPGKVNQLKRKVSVYIPDSTIFLNNEKPINDSISQIAYNFSFASPRSIAALRTFPGGGGSLVTDALDLQNNAIATPGSPFFFASSGWMTLEMKAGNENINQFSKPIELIIPIEDSLINPQTRKAFKEGDEITSWSLNDRGVWKQESQVKVENSKEGLVAKMRIRHLSTWNLDSKLPNCTLTISYNNPSPAIPFNAWSELVGTSNGVPFLAFGPNPMLFEVSTVGTPKTHTILRAPQGVNAVFVVYDNDSEATSARVTSPQFIMCTPPPAFDIPPLTIATKKLSFQIQDLQNTPTNYNICKNAVWYRLCKGGVGELPFACIASECQTSLLPFLFGGMLKSGAISTDPAIVTLYSTQPFTDNCCIRLWYGKKIDEQTAAPITIDFSLPMNPTPGIEFSSLAQTLSGGVTGIISFKYILDPVTSIIRIRLDGGAMANQLSTIAACN
jgi:hypothetical protein